MQEMAFLRAQKNFRGSMPSDALSSIRLRRLKVLPTEVLQQNSFSHKISDGDIYVHYEKRQQHLQLLVRRHWSSEACDMHMATPLGRPH